ncbi:MAG TPA: hypothetical protein VJO32_11835 [Ktedonobacteraceae bacterium]|nr:hypothetical protein [Ktedonobacteraceae bacterium]
MSIGKYGVHMEEAGLILVHPTGISFALTQDETVALMRFIKVYHDAIESALRNTEPRFQRIAIPERTKTSKRARGKRK